MQARNDDITAVVADESFTTRDRCALDRADRQYRGEDTLFGQTCGNTGSRGAAAIGNQQDFTAGHAGALQKLGREFQRPVGAAAGYRHHIRAQGRQHVLYRVGVIGQR